MNALCVALPAAGPWQRERELAGAHSPTAAGEGGGESAEAAAAGLSHTVTLFPQLGLCVDQSRSSSSSLTGAEDGLVP